MYNHNPVLKNDLVLLIALCFFVLPCKAGDQARRVDFSYAPHASFTAICFPDDWQKTVVTSEGALGYDFGPGPYAKPLTEISVGVLGATLRADRQYLEDPQIPIVTTNFAGDGLSMVQQAFAVVPSKADSIVRAPRTNRVHRVGGLTGCIGWASPSVPCDPAFRNVAWGTNRPIRYLVNVPAGSKKLVALGMCESYRTRAGMRALDIRVEGAHPVTVDPVVDDMHNRPRVVLINGQDENRDGHISIEVFPSPTVGDPNVLLNAFWIFPENSALTAESIVRGELSKKAEVYYDCGRELEESAPVLRNDAILASFAGRSCTPVVTVKSVRSLSFDEQAGILRTDDRPYLISRPKPVSARRENGNWILTLPEGTTKAEVIVFHGKRGRGTAPSIPDLESSLQHARKFWLRETRFPKNPIQVPDSGIQYLIDANVRNLYQVRERVDGYTQFQPGPSVYRGLWVSDVAFVGMPILMLGDTLGVRQYLENVIRYQLPSGQIRVIYPTQLLVETPVTITAMCKYARWTNNRQWLAEHWPVIEHGIDWIRKAREQTLADPHTPYAGLMPPGFVDGGIANETADYGSMWWSMICLEQAIETAQWLAKPSLVQQWQSLYDSFLTSFRQAARRDMRKDQNGNTYLPIGVADTSSALPQKGQYAFLWPLQYGKFFMSDDSLITLITRGTLAMLDAKTREGLITSSGWLQGGVWPWLGGLHAIAHQRVGNNGRAIDLLYAFANHASPAGTWVEEQLTRDIGTRTTGDASNSEASAVFIHAVRNLIAQEHFDDLELLPCIPEDWLTPKARIELNNGLTAFGPATLKLSVSADGKTARVYVSEIDGRNSKGSPKVILEALKRQGFRFLNGDPLPDTLQGTWHKRIDLTFRKLM